MKNRSDLCDEAHYGRDENSGEFGLALFRFVVGSCWCEADVGNEMWASCMRIYTVPRLRSATRASLDPASAKLFHGISLF